MAHEIGKEDGIFSVREVPWHKLGVVLNEPPTITEAIQCAKLDWEVELQPLFLGDQRKITDKAIIRKDTNTYLGVVGPRYQPLQNTEAFSIFQPLVDSGMITLETAGSLMNGKRVWILANTKAEEAINGGDEIKLYMLLSNAHDGTQAIRLGFTPIRVVCNNTLTAAHNSAESKLIKVIHTSKAVQNLEALRNIMNLAKGEFQATMEVYRALKHKEISAADLKKYVKVVFDCSTTVEGEKEKRVVAKIINLFENGCGHEIAGKTAWGAYNAVTEHISHEYGRTPENRLNALWFGVNKTLNQKALNVAVDMFLKAA